MRIKSLLVFLLSTLQLATSSSAAEISMHDYKGGGWIELSGEITKGDARKIAEAVRGKSWNHTALYFSSPGGNALEGIRIGMLARTMGYSTVVGNRFCASACALAWAGGEPRLMMPDARVGYHSTYTLDETGQPLRSDEGNSVVRSYVALLGLPPEALVLMTHAEPEEMLWLTPETAAFGGMDFIQLNPARDVIPYSQR